MVLSSGARLGPYAIVAPLGAGGMGEVYEATDTRLDRTVAIKILPSNLSDNPRLRQRFEREARALAGLSHPHICALHDVGHEAGVDFLVMEHLEGETLAERLQRGPLEAGGLLRAAIEIADALDAAHRRGVVHRDLKPGNIMLTKGGIKLLDFGLARLSAPIAPGQSTETSATATRHEPITTEGAILGTLNYMAPEQLKGREADARTDMFAFGAVLYEMATGSRAFHGDSQAELIASILTASPRPMAALRPEVHPALARAVERCLTKDPDERWQSARDLMLELKWIAGRGAAEPDRAPAGSAGRWPLRIAWAISLLLAAALALLTMRPDRPARVPDPARLSLSLPQGVNSAFLRASPDGRTIAINASADGQSKLWLRSLDALAPRLLPRTEGARFPFWSPDSRHIGFFADGKLKKMAVSGGPPQVLCDVPGQFTMGAWSRHGTILFNVFEAPGQEGIYRIADAGGTATRLTLVDDSDREVWAAWPSFLPDGRRFVVTCEMEGDTGLCVASLDSSRVRMLLPIQESGARAEYAPPGHLLYTRGDVLLAQAFDTVELRLHGEPVTIADRIEHYGPVGLDNFSVSARGLLVYRTEEALAQLEWKDRNGRTLGQVGKPGPYQDLSLSPDDRNLAVSRVDSEDSAGDLWIIDLERDVTTRFTSGPDDDMGLLWSPDSRRIVFSSTDNVPPFLHIKNVAGGEPEVLLPSRGTLQVATGWSPDGRRILYGDRDPITGWDIWILPFEGERQPVPFLRTEFGEGFATFSPSGKWIAYASDESTRWEVYVRPLRDGSETRRVSTDGGYRPRWRHDGKELFYIDLDGRLMAVEVTSEATFTSGTPQALFSYDVPANIINPYDVTSDGQRFILATLIAGESRLPTVIIEWTALLPGRD